MQGVDEGDIIKTDGTNIYVVTGNSLEILRAYPAENATVLSSQKFYGTPQSLYINGDRLVLICSEISRRNTGTARTISAVIPHSTGKRPWSLSIPLQTRRTRPSCAKLPSMACTGTHG